MSTRKSRESPEPAKPGKPVAAVSPTHQLTMEDIARAVGLSRMSVSLALRNSPRISLETKRQILAKASEMGYRPNPMVSALMSQLRRTKVYESSAMLAFITAHPTRDGWKTSGPGWQFYLGAKQRAESLGFGIETIWAKEPGMTGKRMTTILHTRNISGIIVAPLYRSCGHLSLKWDLFSSVVLGYSSSRPNLHRVAPDTFQGTMLALRKLWHLGYRRIGLVIPRETDVRTDYRISSAYLRFQQRLKRALQMPPFIPVVKSVDNQFMSWFQEKRPEAIISIIPEVRSWLQQKGFEAPRDYGLAMINVSSDRRGKFAGIDQRYESVGATAVDLLSKQIFHSETGVPRIPQNVLIEGVWLDGESVSSRA